MNARTARRAVLALLVAAPACAPIETEVGAWNEALAQAVYLEAEAGELSGGFTIVEEASASAGKGIASPPDFASDVEQGTARARYEFSLEAGVYLIWGRLLSPDGTHNRLWVQLNGGEWTLWRMSVGDRWYWDDVHVNTNYGVALEFSLPAGAQELVLANAVDGVLLDRLYVTALGDEPPGNDTPCHPPHSIESMGLCLPSCGSLHGTSCDEVTCRNLPLLDVYDCGICCRPEP